MPEQATKEFSFPDTFTSRLDIVLKEIILFSKGYQRDSSLGYI